MEQPPAFTPEQLAVAQAAAQPQVGEPQPVKIFGIMHLVFGAYGIFNVVIAIAFMVFGNFFLKFLPQTPEMAAQAAAQDEMTRRLMPLSIATTVLTIAVTALIIIAGIALLKKRRSGLKWSNRYAISSIIMKILLTILTITFTFPATKEMMQSHSPSGAHAVGVEIGMMFGTLVGVLLPIIYPIVALILLNRPAIKDWFANRPA